MSTSLLPHAVPADTEPSSPQEVAETFLHALAVSDVPRAMALLAEDVEYSNVGLPTIHGRAKVERALGGLAGPNSSFEVYLHSIATDDATVLTERTDVICVGRLRCQFWVWGRFDVHEGRITLWRDSFDFLDIAKGMLRGLLGIAVSSVRPMPPGLSDTPGR